MTNRLVVFIHGLGGDAVSTWEKFPDLLRADNEVASQYANFYSFPYKTGILTSTRSLSKIACELENFIEDLILTLNLDEIAFITHSQGINLARRYLCDVLLNNQKHCMSMPKFRLLSFAGPHWGAALPNIVRKFLPQSWVQQIELAFDSDFINTINKDWALVDADNRVKVLRVAAENDSYVHSFSAHGANYRYEHKTVREYDHVNIVKLQDVSHPSFRIAKKFLLETTPDQPDWTSPVLSCEPYKGEVLGNNRFVYKTQYVKFFGREKEINQLKTLLDLQAQENFAWMCIKGQGGVGKSRLAFELCITVRNHWYAGFLNRDAVVPNWALWQPESPTLIVIDYATADIDKLGQLLRGLSNRDVPNHLRRPVRVLLLDRTQQQDRLKKAIGHDSNSMRINACHQKDLELVKTDDPWAIIEDFLSRSNFPIPNKNQTVDQLIRIDPEQRPFFAMLLADAISQGLDFDTITRESILENVIERERENYWLPAAKGDEVALEKHEKLLAFATIVNGYMVDISDVSPSMFKIMSGFDSQLGMVAPLAPNLLGECFALQKLNSLPRINTYRTLELAWSLWPSDTFDFFNRVTQDFPLDAILNFTLDVSPTSREGRYAWSYWVTNFISRIGAKFSERAVHALKLLKIMAEKHPDEPEIRSEQAKATRNLMCFANLIDPVTTLQVYTELCVLAQAHTNELLEIGLAKVQATINLKRYLREVDPSNTNVVLMDLRKLVDANYGETEKQLEFIEMQVRASFGKLP